MIHDYFPFAWLNRLESLMIHGRYVSPRGQETRELPQATMDIDMRYPVLTIPERKLNYQFMAAEAYWILTGDDTVKGIAPWNKNISQFSDDSKVFFGAYGPMIVSQLEYVVRKLIEDRDTRQAGLTIWRPNPPQTKDVPCTISIFFNIRNGKLNCHTFMRSSDIWLGIPYDVFNFSMLSYLVCAKLHEAGVKAVPGNLYLTAASSHIYGEHFKEAERLYTEYKLRTMARQNEVVDLLYKDSNLLLSTLGLLRNTKPGDDLRWWEL